MFKLGQNVQRVKKKKRILSVRSLCKHFRFPLTSLVIERLPNKDFAQKKSKVSAALSKSSLSSFHDRHLKNRLTTCNQNWIMGNRFPHHAHVFRIRPRPENAALIAYWSMRLKNVLTERLNLTLQEDLNLILFNFNWFSAPLSSGQMEKLVLIIEFYGFLLHT